ERELDERVVRDLGGGKALTFVREPVQDLGELVGPLLRVRDVVEEVLRDLVHEPGLAVVGREVLRAHLLWGLAEVLVAHGDPPFSVREMVRAVRGRAGGLAQQRSSGSYVIGCVSGQSAVGALDAFSQAAAHPAAGYSASRAAISLEMRSGMPGYSARS